MIRNYIKIAWRNVRKNKIFSFINIFGLTIGLASCMLICLYIYDEISYDKHHGNVAQLYQVGTIFLRGDENHRVPNTPGAVAEAMKLEFPEIKETTRLVGLFVDDKTLIKYDSGKESKVFYETKGFLADPTFFSFFKYDFIEGNANTALEKPNTIVLSEDIAKKIFGNERALNKVIHIGSNTNGEADFTVTGIFKPSAAPSHIDGRFFMSYAGGGLESYVKSQRSMAGNNLFFTYLRLKKGADPKKLEAKFPAFINKYMGEDLKRSGFGKKQFLIPVKDIHLYSGMPENVTPTGSTTYLYILLSITLFTILIACINYMNLSTARASRRLREIGVKKVLGIQRSMLIKQFLAESVLLSLMAFALALMVVLLLIPAFEGLSGKEFSYSFSRVGGLLMFFLGLSIITGLIAGSYPALYLSSFKPVKILKGQLSNTFAALSLRKGLVVFQFAIAMILVVASVIIFNQMNFMRTKDLGFTKDQQIVIPLRSESAKSYYGVLKTELLNSSEIESVGASAYYPGIFNPEDANFYKEGQTMDDAKHTRTNRVDYGFIETLHIELVAGRKFSKQFSENTSMIINEEASRMYGFISPQEAVGKKIYTDREGQRYHADIIGVVRDFHFEDLRKPITPFGFTLNEGGNYNYIIAQVKGKDVGKALDAITSIWQKTNPNEPFEFTFLDEDFQKNYEAENRLSSIIGYFTLIAILISCLGLFGLVSFSAEQRTKEIGIRKVLGANVKSIVDLLLKDFLKLVFVAIIIASPFAYYFMDTWLQNFAYKTSIAWWIFVLSGSVMLIITLLTVSFQAIKAAVANPVKSLRTE
ncbi:MAG TPA: ABC transporter permease [Flavobacteriaceae bacterium]